MSASLDPFESLREFAWDSDRTGKYYSLPALEKAGIGPISRLPVCIRLVLESVLRHCPEHATEAQVRELANWKPKAARSAEIPFVVARIVLQDFTGVPLLVDLAAMRSAVRRRGGNPEKIKPFVPVDLVVDHSIQVDFAGSEDAMQKNLAKEFERNRERYEFLKWGMQAFDTFKVVPPGIGIVHQVNLEYLAQVVVERNGLYYPDTLVGTDSHTTMINGLGVVGWGVGGIEAEAGMLGQPLYFLTPDVVGVHLKGNLAEGATATDLALTLTELLREAKVVGKFVEFYGEGTASLPVVDRATIANMAPEYGATMGFFPIDRETIDYLRATGRSEEHCRRCESYFRAQGLWNVPRQGDIEYSIELELDLGEVRPSVAGPKRPQDRVPLPQLGEAFRTAFSRSPQAGGFGKPVEELQKQRVTIDATNGSGKAEIGHGHVLIAAITSCTNTSNPNVMLAAGLLAKKAVERGLKVPSTVKTSLAPGSRVVSDYLEQTGLQPYLNRLGFHLVGYGCTTCIGNSGPLAPPVEQAILNHDLVAAAVLSGNRNFEARVHPNIKANYLMSPPLVVAFALAGRVDIDLSNEPLGQDPDGQPVFLADLWPSAAEINDHWASALAPESFLRLYRQLEDQNAEWSAIPATEGAVYDWNPESTYIQEPPFFADFDMNPQPIAGLRGARVLGLFGDSVTTDHISPAGAIKPDSPAGRYLQTEGVTAGEFNSYGSRRGNDRVMTRGTFANVRIRNLMVPGSEGGVTRRQPEGDLTAIYEAAENYSATATPLIVIAGKEYGVGSSRDWAAKGTRLLGVKAVVAEGFERIHRSNLVGMGVLPLQFPPEQNARTLGLEGTETYDLEDLDDSLRPQQDLTLTIRRDDDSSQKITVRCRIDTPIEIDYYRHGGILPYVLRLLIADS